MHVHAFIYKESIEFVQNTMQHSAEKLIGDYKLKVRTCCDSPCGISAFEIHFFVLLDDPLLSGRVSI